MDKYQKAAKLLNERAPVDGKFGKERIAYINPLEEDILKSIGGSGEVIIPGSGEQQDPDVPSYGIFKWFKKKIFDDILGIDDNKFLGMKNKTFLGGALNTVKDDWLGIDSSKTFGISDATWDDLASTIVGVAGGGLPGALAWTIGDKIVENNSGDTSGRQKQREDIAAARAAYRTNAAKDRAANLSTDDLANQRGLMTNLVSRGKAGLLDPSDTERMQTLLASPGDDAYEDGFSLGGQDMDPFPKWLRESGDTINDTINNTGKYANDYLGSADQRMYDFQPVLDRMKGMSLDAMSELGSIYDRGPGGLENRYRQFQDGFNELAGDQQDLNMLTAMSNQGLVDDVLTEGSNYANALRDSKALQTGLTNSAFDELSKLEQIKRDQNTELQGRFADTRDAGIGLNRELEGRLGDTRDRLRDVYSELGGRFSDTRDAQYGAADRIQQAERAKALAAGANAENSANADQRGIRSATVGQGTGTGQSMANAMIRSQLGQQRGDLLANAMIRDAERRGEADVGMARKMENVINNQADLDMAQKMEGVLDGNFGYDYAGRMENILGTDADRLGAEIGADRYSTLSELDPGSGEVMGAQADLQNRLRGLDYGDQMLSAMGANLGIDQSILDDERGLMSSITNMRLGNTGMIPALGMQYAQLPAAQLEAALAPMGPLIRNTSPYTSSGQLSAPTTMFSPAPSPTPSMNWTDYARAAPQVLGGIREIQDIWS